MLALLPFVPPGFAVRKQVSCEQHFANSQQLVLLTSQRDSNDYQGDEEKYTEDYKAYQQPFRDHSSVLAFLFGNAVLDSQILKGELSC